MVITEEMIISGFISKIVSDVVDIPENLIKDAIRNADKKKRDKNQTIETRVYQVTIDSINKYTNDEYKGQDVLYDAAECMIKGFRNRNEIEAVRMGLKLFPLKVISETCEDFLIILQHEICMDENDILYKEISMIQGRQTIKTIREGFDVSNKNDEETHEKLNHVIERIDNINKKTNGTENCEIKYCEIPIKNRADEYVQRWNKNVFLNNFKKRDMNAGVNIKLQEIYPEKHLPHYVWKMDDKPLEDLRELLSEYTVDNDDKKMLLILGHAGIGKSTLITWIMANLVEDEDNFLVYQFATDLKNANWQNDNILDEIFAAIGLEYNELEGKTLILDGFDEICVRGDRERILHRMNQELEKKNFLKTFSIIITCRENYVDKVRIEGIEYITLQTWDEGQIRSFCEIYEEVIKKKNSGPIVNKNLEIKINKMIVNKDIMGIPLILYMVLALNVDIESDSSIVDIFDQIFSLKKGGIYDRRYDVEHRINEPETKGHIHHISQRIAFWMFENNADEATIPQENFEEICENEMIESGKKGEEIQSNTLIGNFFRLKYCEGEKTDELQFVHRSIYEYFVAIYFFESLHKLKSRKEVVAELGRLLKSGILSNQIGIFIYCKFDNREKCNLSNNIKEIFNMMLREGMTYRFTEKQEKPLLKNIEQEENIFFNMLNVVKLWHRKLGKCDDRIMVYLKCNTKNHLNLGGIELDTIGVSKDLRGVNLNVANLSNANLSGFDLSGAYLRANLEQAILRKTDLRRAYLGGAYLREADLSWADLSGAYLKNVDLKEAVLYHTIFDELQISVLQNKYDLSKSSVLLSETEEVISYQEYCIRKKAI